MMSGGISGWSDAQMERLRPFFPKSQRQAAGGDRRVLSAIILLSGRNGLQWKDRRAVYGAAEDAVQTGFVRSRRAWACSARIFA